MYRKLRDHYANRSRILFKVLVVGSIACAHFLSGCSHLDTIDTSTKTAAKHVKVACSDLPSDLRPLCQETVKKRLAYYKIARTKQQAALRVLQKAHDDLITKCYTLQNKHLGPDGKPPAEYWQAKKSLEEIRMRHTVILKAQNTATVRAYESFAEIPHSLAEYKAKAKVICRATHSGRIDCVQLSTLLAMYDSDMTNAILSDIERLYEYYGLDESKDVLLNCDFGWGAVDAADLGLAGRSGSFAGMKGLSRDSTLDTCDRLMSASSGAPSGSGGGAGGFSGLTGFDPFRSSVCGEELVNPNDKVFALLVQTMEAFLEECEPSLTETIMEDGEAPDPPHNLFRAIRSGRTRKLMGSLRLRRPQIRRLAIRQ